MGWVLSPAIYTLRKQLDELFPNRDRRSDGTIGDEAHRKTKSDHNPNAAGYVCAFDIDKDLGIDMDILRRIVEKDVRTNYTIFKREIRGRVEFKPRPYSGLNAHLEHLHLSIRQEPKYYLDGSLWDLSALGAKPVTKPIVIPPSKAVTNTVQSISNKPNGSTTFPTDYENLVLDKNFAGLSIGALQILMHAIGKRNNRQWDGIARNPGLTWKDAQEWLADLGKYKRKCDGDFKHYSVVALQEVLRERGFYNKTPQGIPLVVDGKWQLSNSWTSYGFQQYLNTQNGR